MICPSCGTSIQKAISDSCPVCNCDLGALLRVRAVPDFFYNQGLEACRGKKWYSAIEALATVCNMNPTDADAHVLLGKVYIELKQLPEAAAHFSRAFKINARNQSAVEGLHWLNSMGCEIPD